MKKKTKTIFPTSWMSLTTLFSIGSLSCMRESLAVLTDWHPSRLTHVAILDAAAVWAFSPGCQPEFPWSEEPGGPPCDLNSHGMKAGSERNILRKQARMPNENCKASFDLILVPSATSEASLYSQHVARVPGEGVDSPPPGGARQGHLVEEHMGWKMWLQPSLENAICHLQSLKVP